MSDAPVNAATPMSDEPGPAAVDVSPPAATAAQPSPTRATPIVVASAATVALPTSAIERLRTTPARALTLLEAQAVLGEMHDLRWLRLRVAPAIPAPPRANGWKTAAPPGSPILDAPIIGLADLAWGVKVERFQVLPSAPALQPRGAQPALEPMHLEVPDVIDPRLAIAMHRLLEVIRWNFHAVGIGHDGFSRPSWRAWADVHTNGRAVDFTNVRFPAQAPTGAMPPTGDYRLIPARDYAGAQERRVRVDHHWGAIPYRARATERPHKDATVITGGEISGWFARNHDGYADDPMRLDPNIVVDAPMMRSMGHPRAELDPTRWSQDTLDAANALQAEFRFAARVLDRVLQFTYDELTIFENDVYARSHPAAARANPRAWYHITHPDSMGGRALHQDHLHIQVGPGEWTRHYDAPHNEHLTNAHRAAVYQRTIAVVLEKLRVPLQALAAERRALAPPSPRASRVARRVALPPPPPTAAQLAKLAELDYLDECALGYTDLEPYVRSIGGRTEADGRTGLGDVLTIWAQTHTDHPGQLFIVPPVRSYLTPGTTRLPAADVRASIRTRLQHRMDVLAGIALGTGAGTGAP